MVEPTRWVDVNISFNEQPQIENFLSVRYEGPISEGLMHHLHSLVTQAIQQELDRLGLDIRYLGIRLGYDLSEVSEVSEQLVETDETCAKGSLEQHYVECWGCYTQHQALLQYAELVDENMPSPSDETDDISDKCVSREFLDSLLSQVQKTINFYISPSDLGGRSIQFWLFGYAQGNLASSLHQLLVFASSDEACCTTAQPHHRKTGGTSCTGKPCA